MDRFRGPVRLTLFSVVLLPGLLAPRGCGRPSDGGDTTTPTTTSSAATRASDALRSYPLGSLPTTWVSIDEHLFRVWVARESAPPRPGARRTLIEEGLMFVPPEEIADDQGMLFVFSNESIRGFWMWNTVTPLDIAFARMNGTIVKIWQMPPGTLRTFSSIEPAMFALEVKQGTFERLGIHEGDRIDIPRELLTDAE